MGHAFPLRVFHPLRVFLVVLTCAMLAGCGRKGTLEPRPGSPQAQGPTAAQQATILGEQDTPGLIQGPNKFYDEPAGVKLEKAQRRAAEAGAPRAINAPPVDKPRAFLLDPLL